MNLRHRFISIVLLLAVVTFSLPAYAQGLATATRRLAAPTPLATTGQPVDWLFVFKFNSATFPGQICAGGNPVTGSAGVFGGTVQAYQNGRHSQQYAYATSAQPTLKKGEGCLGATLTDPLGATFAQVYDTPGYNYVIWNDQFYDHPIGSKESPFGHSKGMVAWNDDGDGFVLQVSTPSWPGSGSKGAPREKDGNTLGCILDDDVEVSQHFFALKINKDDLVAVLNGLANASVVTSVQQPELVHNGGPAAVQTIVNSLGQLSKSKTCTVETLSTGVKLISKPSKMALPPWQLVSGKLDGLPLRVASWWATPFIYSTSANTAIEGWPANLTNPGPVAIATSGTWGGATIGLIGGDGPDFNHAKIGISTDQTRPICIFGDMNQQGALHTGYAHPGQPMTSSQNGRGGTFYALSNQKLFDSLTELLKGATAPENLPNGEEEQRPRRNRPVAAAAR